MHISMDFNHAIFKLLEAGITADIMNIIVKDAKKRGINFMDDSMHEWLKVSRAGATIQLTRRLRAAIWKVQSHHEIVKYCNRMAVNFELEKRSGESAKYSAACYRIEGAILARQERDHPSFYDA